MGWIHRALLAVVTATTAIAFAAQASTVSLLPNPQTIALVGNSANVTISVDSMTNVEGFSFGILFDATVVKQIGSITLGTLLPAFDGMTGCLVPTIVRDNTLGKVCISTACVEGHSGMGDLMVIPFQGVDMGMSALTFSSTACSASPPAGGCSFESNIGGASTCSGTTNGEVDVLGPTHTPTETPTLTQTPTLTGMQAKS